MRRSATSNLLLLVALLITPTVSAFAQQAQPNPPLQPVPEVQLTASVVKGCQSLQSVFKAPNLADRTDQNFIHVANARSATNFALVHYWEPLKGLTTDDLNSAREYLIKVQPTSPRAISLQLPEITWGAIEIRTIRDSQSKLLVTLVTKDLQPDLPKLNTNQASLITTSLQAVSDAQGEVPSAAWPKLDKFWRSTQASDGHWQLNPNDPPGSINGTLAALASLLIVRTQTSADINANPKPDKAIDAAFNYLDRNLTPASLADADIESLARIVDLTGRQYFHGMRVRDAVARQLLQSQKADGTWLFPGHDAVESTSLAVTWLTDLQSPVFIHKLQYRDPHWNARPLDAYRLNQWVIKQRCQARTRIQVVSFDDPLELWCESPILLITGSTDPKFTAADIAQLRAYIQAGGTVFSVADGAPEVFTNAIRKAAGQIGENQYEMRPLPATHVIFGNELWANIKNPPAMLGMSNGVRDFWFHSTVDMGASWQLQKFATKEHFEIPMNLYFYATGRDFRCSAFGPAVPPVALAMPAPPFALTLVRLDYVGNADPEPGAWPRLAAQLRAQGIANLTLTTLKIADLDPQKHALAHLTGTSRFTLNAADSLSLKAYINHGGTLLIDSAGGSKDFTASALQLLSDLSPQNAPTPLNRNSPLYLSLNPAGFRIMQPEMRRYSLIHRASKVVPDILTVSITNRPAILFSELDLTSGLLGTNTWAIDGYTPETSSQLATNLLLWLAQPPAPPPAPAAPAPPAKNP